MDKISELRAEFEQKLTQIADLVDLDKLRVDYLGKKGSITALLKNMKALSNEEKRPSAQRSTGSRAMPPRA